MLLAGSCLLLLGGLLLAGVAHRARRRWMVVPRSCRGLLLSRNWTEPEALLDLAVPVVSGHPGRDVARVSLGPGQGTAYLKRQRQISWKERLWGSRCLREARMLDTLHREGLPAPRWLAAGEDGAGRAFVLIAAVPGARPLAAWLRATPDPVARRALAERLGADLARLHAAGFVHGDLYAKHVLVSPEGPGCCFLDWQRARRVGRGRRAAASRRRDLSALHATLPADLAGARLRLACLRAYRRGLAGAGDRAYLAPGSIDAESQRLLRRHRHVREKRDLAPGLEQAWLPPAGGPPAAEMALTSAGVQLCPAGVEPWLTPPPVAEARRWLELAGGRRALLLWRRQRAGRLLSWAGSLVGYTPLSWEQHQAVLLLRLERLGLDAPRPLAAGSVGAARFLLCEPPADTADLETWLRRAPGPDRAEVLVRVGSFLRRLHDACFYLRGGRLAVRLEGPPTPILPDLGGLEARRRASHGLAAADLSALRGCFARAGCTTGERNAFRAGYCTLNGCEIRSTGCGVQTAPGGEEMATPARTGGDRSSFPIPRSPFPIEAGRWRVLQAPDWALFAGPAWPERIMQVEVTDRFSAKQGRSTGRWVLQAGGSRLVVYLKRHYQLPWWLGLLARAWPACYWSPALREWQHLDWARSRGVPVPRTVAAGERVGPGCRLQSFLAVEELTDMLPVNEAVPLARAQLGPAGFRRWKRGLAAEMARVARLLHDQRRYHKDLYLCHFYLHQDDTTTPAPAGGWAGRVFLIDLHRLERHPWTWPLWLVKDLAQLLYSSAIPGVDLRDRLWFWRCYRGPGAPSQTRGWLRRGVLLKWRLYQRHAQRRKRRAETGGQQA
jgi:heptose I phosphotransferase